MDKQICVKCHQRYATPENLKRGVRGCDSCVAEGTQRFIEMLNTWPSVAAKYYPKLNS